jgi:hypothetical protein
MLKHNLRRATREWRIVMVRQQAMLATRFSCGTSLDLRWDSPRALWEAELVLWVERVFGSWVLRLTIASAMQ